MTSTFRAAATVALVGAVAIAAAVTGTTGTAQAATTSTKTTTTVTPTTIRTAANTTLFKGGLYVQPDSQPAQAAASLSAAGQTSQAAAAATIAKQPIAIWLGEWYTGSLLDSVISRNVAKADAAGTTPVFVTYAIPNRDCGGYSAGGLTDSSYIAWNQQIANDLQGHRAIVLVEPDAISQLPQCTSDTANRLSLIKQAVEIFRAASVPTYLDGGDSNWNKPAVQASMLNQAGIADARGFFTNVSNYYGVDPERAYADQVSALTGGSHYVIDVSRNGQGWKGTWCNAPGAGLGQAPHVTAGTSKLDALLWVKTPGASDGTCNGGPAAGSWYASYAVALVANGKL
jgi:endoglucanase